MPKKPARKKAAAAAGHDFKVSFNVKPEHIAAIQRCLQKGKLTITVSSKKIAGGRALDGYLYD
jgi:hypothetical protein